MTATVTRVDPATRGIRISGTGVGPATQLRVVTQPAGAEDDVVFDTQPVVEILDAQGNRRTSSTAEVTAAKGSGSGTLAGDTAVNAVAGVATFTDLEIQGSGIHTLDFSSTGLSGVTSSSFDVDTSGGSGGQVTAVFQSDWSHGTGTTDEFLGDNGKWPTINSPAANLHDVIAAPAGFPAPMDNVYRQFYTKTGSPGCTNSGTWAALAVESTRHFRFYHLLDSNYNPTSGDTSKHNYLPSPNEHFWAFQQEQSTGTTYWWDFQCYDTALGATGSHRYRVTGLEKGEVYRMHCWWERTSTTTYRFSAEIHDSAGNLVADNDDFSCITHAAHAINPTYEHTAPEGDFDSLTGCRISMEGVAGADETPVNDFFLTGGWVVVDDAEPGEYGDVAGEATS